jgi:hypothetical protein
MTVSLSNVPVSPTCCSSTRFPGIRRTNQVWQRLPEVLKARAPDGLVAVLDWAFWRMNSRQGEELKALHAKTIPLAEVQAAAITKVEAALVALKESTQDLRRT